MHEKAYVCNWMENSSRPWSTPAEAKGSSESGWPVGKVPGCLKNLHSVSCYFVFFFAVYLQPDTTVKCSTCRGVDITTMKQLSTLGALFSTANACSSNGCMITLVSALCGEELCLWWLGECPRWLRCCAVDFLHNLRHERSVWEGDAGRCTGCSSSHPLHGTRGQPLISSSWVQALLCSSQTRRWHFTFIWSCFWKNDDENHPNHATALDIDSLFCYVFRSHYGLYSL